LQIEYSRAFDRMPPQQVNPPLDHLRRHRQDFEARLAGA
jgi:hypothetical protein